MRVVGIRGTPRHQYSADLDFVMETSFKQRMKRWLKIEKVLRIVENSQGLLVALMRQGRKSKGRALQPRLRVMRGSHIALGPGKVKLLDYIRERGSIVRAAKRMGMSYMRAWTLIKTMEGCFKQRLVQTQRGGKQGGGADLTETGRKVTALYHGMEENCLKATRRGWRKMLRELRG